MSTTPHVNRWRAFALLAVAYFMTIIDLTIVNVSLPTIGRDLHFSETSLQWVITAYSLTFGGLLLLGGRAADLLGRRRVLMFGLGLFTAASLACGLATGEAFLIASRAVQGVGAAIMLPSALSIVMNMFQEGADRNKALGIWGGIAAGGATVGLITGGVLTRYAGWQYIFYLNVPIGAAALVLVPRVVPDSRLATSRRRFDARGAITGTAGLVLLVDAISQAPQYGWGATRTVAVLAAAMALLVGFLMIESRAEAPVLPLSIFRLRTLAGANIAGLLLGGSFYAFLFIGTLYMQDVLHYTAIQSGAAWLAASLTSIVLAGLSQLLVTRIGAKIVMAIGMTLIGAGILWATQVPVHGHFLANLAGPMAIAGAGTAFGFIPISIAGLAGIREHQAGLASGLLNTSQQLGGAIGIAIASSVAATHTQALLHAGNAAPAALTGGFQQALWVLGAIALLALPAIFVLVRGNELSAPVAETAIGETHPALVRATRRWSSTARVTRARGPAFDRSDSPDPSQHTLQQQAKELVMSNGMTIADKSVIVTGGNRGLGQALVNEALTRGAKQVYVGTRQPLDHPDRRVKPLVMDVTDATQIQSAVESVESLDILINNAGISLPDDLSDRAAFDEHLAVNLFGMWAVTQAFLPSLIQSRGRVVNVVSVGAFAAVPILPAYSASKAAAFSLTQSLRALLAAQGVAVHAVMPGPIDTDMIRDLPVPKTPPKSVARAIFDGVQNEEEEIFPDPFSESLAEDWRNGAAKELERQNAALIAPQPLAA